MTDETENPKAGAVEQWERALAELPVEPDYAQQLREADIHDRRDRMEIEELIEHEVLEEQYLDLHDAWSDLNRTFEGMWDD